MGGGAVYWKGMSGNLINCIFINNNVINNNNLLGGAVNWNGANGNLFGSVFINNSAVHGGAVFWNGINGTLTESIFTNNSGSYGGSLNWYGANGTLSNSTFTGNIANVRGGAIHWSTGGANGTLTNCHFLNNFAILGGGIYWDRPGNITLFNSTFTGNTASSDGGAAYWNNILGGKSRGNITMRSCNFIDNHAPHGDNVFWYYTADDFLNNYGQINDFDYVWILNSIGTPSKTIVLNKKGITIHGQSTNVIFDAKGGNFHFEVTGEDILIENLSFRNFNFTTGDGWGGAIEWKGNNGILQNCIFINNTASVFGGGVYWRGVNGTIKYSTFNKNIANANSNGGGAVCWSVSGFYGNLIGCIFTGNTATTSGGAVLWGSPYGTLTNCIFINNTANYQGGAVYWRDREGTLTNSTFISNVAPYAGAVLWSGINGIMSDCKFNNHSVTGNGGAVRWAGANGSLTSSIFTDNISNWGGAVDWYGQNGSINDCTFNDNTARLRGGAAYWNVIGSMINCKFINSKSQTSNGIYANTDLNINIGEGIVYVFVNGTLSGTSIVVLNNETYYYPPSTNINFI